MLMPKPIPAVSDYFRVMQKASAARRWAGKSEKERSEVMKAVALARKAKKSLVQHLTT